MMRPILDVSYLRMSHAAVINKISNMVKFHNTHMFPTIKHSYMISGCALGAAVFVGGETGVKFELGNLNYRGGVLSRAVLGGTLGYMAGVAFAYTYPIAFPLAMYCAFGGTIDIRMS